MKGMRQGGSLGGEKMKPVTGKSGIKSGGANVPNSKPVQGQGGYGFAEPCKTKMPMGGGKGTGGKM
jgi:hypothetical protein